MTTIEDILNEIEANAGKLNKHTVLAKYIVASRHAEFVQMLKLVLDPNVTFGIKKITSTGVGGGTNIDWNLFKFLLEELRDRKLVGNNATYEVNKYLSTLNPNSAMWATRIIKKNLRAGFSEETVEKIDPTIAQVFKIPLADRFEEVPNELLERSYAVQPKLDGVRAVAIVKNLGNVKSVKFFSRSGLEWINPNFEHIKVEIIARLKASNALRKLDFPVYLDGEIVCMSEDGIPDWNAIQHIMHSEEIVNGGAVPQYVVFDMTPEYEWKQPTLQYSTRLKTAQEYIGEGPHLNVITSSVIDKPTKELMIRVCNDFMMIGYEGAIFRSLKDKVVNKRARSLIKVKTFFDDEATLIGGKMGEGRIAFGIGALEVRHKNGQVFEVGSGLSDFRREWFAKNMDTLKGSLIKYRYQMLSEDGIPRFPTYKGIRSKEDV